MQLLIMMPLDLLQRLNLLEAIFALLTCTCMLLSVSLLYHILCLSVSVSHTLLSPSRLSHSRSAAFFSSSTGAKCTLPCGRSSRRCGVHLCGPSQFWHWPPFSWPTLCSIANPASTACEETLPRLLSGIGPHPHHAIRRFALSRWLTHLKMAPQSSCSLLALLLRWDLKRRVTPDQPAWSVNLYRTGLQTSAVPLRPRRCLGRTPNSNDSNSKGKGNNSNSNIKAGFAKRLVTSLHTAMWRRALHRLARASTVSPCSNG